jgi:hypothetical protein
MTVFEPEESLRYLCKILEKEDIEFQRIAAQLAQELGHLPLTLAQAAAHIKEIHIAISVYHNLFLERRQALLLQHKSVSKKEDYQFIVSVT